MIAKRSVHRVVALIAALGLSWVRAEGDSPHLPDSIGQARFYAWGMVGTPGAISDEEIATRLIARSWSGRQIAVAIPNANLEGRLYLLCVMRRNFPSDYATARKAAGLGAQQTVSIFSGTVLRRVPAVDVIRQFEDSNCEPLAWPQ